jgi:uncharacterized protein YgbK (DUF1537 family)
VESSAAVAGEVSASSRSAAVLVINTDTRHRSPQKAGDTITKILGRYPAVPYVYKKTDSTLRGNIGAELEALVRARTLRALPFIPAYPSLGRTTKDGRQYLEGVPIDKTAMASDALNPILHSFIPDIIAEQSTLSVQLVPRGAGGNIAATEILVYDAESAADLQDITRALDEQKLLGATAGCAGFAETLLERIPFDGTRVPGLDTVQSNVPKPGAAPVLILSGSRHPVSLAQVKAAMDSGVPAEAVDGDKLLSPEWFAGEEARALAARCGEHLAKTGACILGTRMSRGLVPGTGSGAGAGIAGLLGKLAGPIFDIGGPAHLVVFGGDTLLGIMEILGYEFLTPLTEIRPGVVLARGEGWGGASYIVTKSGAFGEPGMINSIIEFLEEQT